ncbi:MAG: tyrosine-type recombinase/integrase [Gammaproteobacteria bacterium]|nr:tyrosine-type recombinase/integrase [Gammaproteobacteria bacterium]
MLSFEFLVLTAARSVEVRSATWDEIDLEAAVWTIRAERMKAAREHRVPPSDRALVVLDEARRELPQAGNLLFPSEKGRLQGHHPMGRMMKTLGIGAVPDGFCQLPRLGRRVHRDAERGLRTRLGARQQRPRGGCLPAQRPIRAPPRPHAGVGRLRRLPG